MTDPYQVLGISSSATDDEVKAAYRKLAKKYHPDHNNGSAEAEKKMMQVNDAYAQIMDMRKNGGSSSSSYSSSGYGGSYGGNGYGGGYGGYGNSYGGSSYSSAQRFAIARQYLAMGRYYEALQILQQINDHSAEWYYLCARARQGMGDDISALNFARQAANMDPGNREYSDFVNDLMAGGDAYRQQSSNFGGIQNAVCNNPCLTCLLFNMCCGGGCGGLRFCLCPC